MTHIHLLNTKACVTIKTPMGDTHPLLLSNLLKQGTVLGPALNNCSQDCFSQERFRTCSHDPGTTHYPGATH